MSLVVSSFWMDPETGVYEEFTDWNDGHHLAGVERARWDIWGSEAVRRRGAKFLPQLSETDLYVGHSDLGEFRKEVQSLLAVVETLGAELGVDSVRLRHYLDNFLRAAEYSKPRNGGVNIT